MAVAPGSQPPPPRMPLAASMPPRVRRVLEHLSQIASSELGRQLHVVLHEAEIELNRQADQSRNSTNERAYVGAVRSLRQHSPQLIPRFIQELEAELAQLHASRATRQLQELDASTEDLSLLDESEMDEGSVLADIATRANLRNSLALQLMGQRFGVLVGASAFDPDHLPLGPHSLCHALRTASEALALPLEVRLQVYKRFDKVTMAHLPTLLETLNTRLASEGILPHLKFVPMSRRPVTPGKGGDAEVALAPRGEPSSTGPHPPDSQPPSSGERQKPPLESFATLQDLLARSRALRAEPRSVGSDERLRQQLTHQDVLGSLRRMRAGAGKHGTPGDIRQTLLAQARQAHGHGVALGDADRDGFELFGLFIGQLQRELHAGSPGETLAEALKLPLLQLALRDHRFFVDPGHPARKLLDAVSVAGARWLGEGDLDPQWLGLLQRAVDTVQEDPDGSEDTFVAANDALQAGLQATARKNGMAERRLVEAARGREKLELARLRASDEIEQLVAGRPLPGFHSMLLEQAWTDVLSLVLLRSGEASEAWRDIRATTIAIVDVSTGAGPRMADPALLATLQDALAQVGYHAEDAGAIARQLASGPADDADFASRTELLAQLKARTRLGQDTLARARTTLPPRTASEQAAYDRLGAIDHGCWIDQHDSSMHSVVRRRLAWTSSRTGHALLLNRRRLRIDGDDLDGLARGLAAGWLQLVEDMHPAELAWQATLADLQRNAGNLPDTAKARMDSNSRRMPRRTVGGSVYVFDTMTDQTMGHLGNLSVGGMLLIASTRLVEDALYQVRFALPDGVEHHIEVGAHVLWLAEASAPGQFWAGVRFIGLAPESTRRLRAWIELDASAR